MSSCVFVAEKENKKYRRDARKIGEYKVVLSVCG